VPATNSGFDARGIANFLLDLARNRRIRLTNLQLQKIVFFAHGAFLQRFRKPLVLNRFEAWEHGPVVPELYHCLKHYGDREITGSASRFDLETRALIRVQCELPPEVCRHLDDMLLFYGRMDPWELVKLSHVEGGPWDTTMKNSVHRSNFSMIIDSRVIEHYFLAGMAQPLQ
jgi:uncharacterized phage-associated protein